jgi:ubiquinone/menaquinone biosynthesis C-methylase UbiE
VTTDRDWISWHDGYDEPDSTLALRLDCVRRRIRETLDDLPAGPVRVVSMCAGQGRDLIGALAGHPRRADVTARLVELAARNVDQGRRAALDAGLPGVEFVEGDAADCASYAGAVPADLVLVCGVFGNITDADIHRTVADLPRLCDTGGTVIWTRHTLAPDRTPSIRDWLAANGFTEIGFDTREGHSFSVGTHRLSGPPLPFRPDRRMFDFVGRSNLEHS